MARNPYPENSSPSTDLDLEAQIVQAEAAVIARDARIRRRSRALVQRVQRGAVRNSLSGVAIAVGAGLVTWWLGRRRPGDAAPAPAAVADKPSGAEHFAREAGLSIASLLPLVWPYMPRGLRRSVTPGTASTVLAIVAPLFARLFRGKRKTA
jgi:hypothetical protein